MQVKDLRDMDDDNLIDFTANDDSGLIRGLAIEP